MEKFKFKPYNSSIDAGVFTMGNGYFESSGEADTRKQLSYPLSNIADYINDKIVPNVNEVKTTTDSLKNELDTCKNDVSLLNGRVDTVTSLPSGSTTGDAELADIRVGANGTTYPNAGGAVRGQINELKDDLVEFENGFSKYTPNCNWETGGFNLIGENVPNGQQVRCDSIDLIFGTTYKIESKSNFPFYVLAMDYNGNYSAVMKWGNESILDGSGYKSARIMIQNVVGETIKLVGDRLNEYVNALSYSKTTCIDIKTNSIENKINNIKHLDNVVGIDVNFDCDKSGWNVYPFELKKGDIIYISTDITRDCYTVRTMSYAISDRIDGKRIYSNSNNYIKITQDAEGIIFYGVGGANVKRMSKEALRNEWIKNNASSDAIIRSAMSNSDCKICHVSDIHANIMPLKHLDFVNSKYDGIDIFCYTGDNNYYGPFGSKGVITGDVIDCIVNSKIYFCVGQHDVSGILDGRNYEKAKCLSHEDAVTTYMTEEVKTALGLDDGQDKMYYYKDFENSKIRLISLYQYDIPLIDNPSDTTKYKYSRATLWYSQEQINWLISSLASTPSGYGVIILKHQTDVENVRKPTDSHNFFVSSSKAPGKVWTNGSPVLEIVEAFKNKTSLSKTFIGDSSVDNISVSVNCDFSTASGKFVTYLSGDVHRDVIGVEKDTTQRNIQISSPTYPEDLTVYNVYENSKCNDVINIIGAKLSTNTIKLARIGVDMSNDMEDRRFAKFDF